VDELTIGVWRRTWEERLVDLSKKVRANTYRPGGLRKRRVPKKRGGYRTLRIPTVTDRVLQRAVFQVLCTWYEPRFMDCSYGYRPGRSLKNALEQILIYRENGLRWVLDADIDSFFDEVDHELLLRFLQADLPDESLLPLVAAWLEKGSSHLQASRGIPQGSPLSPLLANVYLHRLDLALLKCGRNLVRYADDFVVFGDCFSAAEAACHETERILESLSLHFEPSKTRITSFEDGFHFLGVYFFENSYRYLWEDKEIRVDGNQSNWLFGDYQPEYE